jgi:hypothetical protein
MHGHLNVKLFYILAYIRHNGDVPLKKRGIVLFVFFFARELMLGKNRSS